MPSVPSPRAQNPHGGAAEPGVYIIIQLKKRGFKVCQVCQAPLPRMRMAAQLNPATDGATLLEGRRLQLKANFESELSCLRFKR